MKLTLGHYKMSCRSWSVPATHPAREGKKAGAPRDAQQHLLAEATSLGAQEDFLLPKQVAGTFSSVLIWVQQALETTCFQINST